METGGILSMDGNSRLNGKVASNFILAQGDLIFSPNVRANGTEAVNSSEAVNTLDWERVSSTSMSLVARNGNIVLKGKEGTNGAGSASYVARSVLGDLNLVGNNVTLEGVALNADGSLNITALQGNVQVSSLEESLTENGRVKTYWKDSLLEGQQGVNIRAAGNIDMKGTSLRSSNGMVNVQAAGSLTMSGDYAHFAQENDGWLTEYLYIRNVMDISGKQGVSLGALGGNLRLSAQTINAPEGGIQLQALGDISLESAQEYFRSQRSTTKSYSALFGAIKDRVTINEWSDNLKNNPVKLNGKDILVKAGNNLNTYGSQFNATGNLSLQAGDNINYYGVYDQQSSGRDATGSGRFLFTKTGDQVRDTRQQYTGQPTVLQSQQDILSQSGGDQLLQGTKVVYGGTATFQAGVGEKARADAKIILEGLKNSTTQMRSEKRENLVWQSMVDRGSVTETLALPTFSGPSTPVFKAPGGLTVQIPDGGLKTEINKLMTQPGMEYIQTLAARSDINWQPVKLAHEKWDYKQSGLTPAGAALVAVLVAWAMPAAAGTLGGTLSGASATAAGAAMSSLATQATITLINNKGDVGKTLKDMGSSQVVKSTIAAALTAGALETLGGAELMKGLNASNSTLSQQVTYNLINSTTRSLINASITGEDLTNALKVGLITGLVDTAHGQVASKIKLLQDDYIIHKLAHALAGCAAGAATGAACKDGAIGAAVGEIVAELMPPANGIAYSDAEKKNVLALSKLVAGTATAMAGGNAQTGINTAETAVQNNALVPILIGAAWLIDKAWTAYEVSQDIAAIRDGKKTVEQVATERGEEYVTGIILGNIARYGMKAVKVGGKWVQSKVDNAYNINTAQMVDKSGYKPNAGAVRKMEDFLESPGFGSALGNASQKTSKVVGGTSVYKANEKINEYIRKGDQFYIDKQHMNHIEVFDSNNKARAVLNLDGSLNVAKTQVALKQGRTIPK